MSQPRLLDCPNACEVPDGVELRETPRPRHDWGDMVHCPHEECQRSFLALRRDLDVPHGTPVDDQPAAADERHLPHLGADEGALDRAGVDGGAVGVGGVDGVRDVVDDEGHAARVAQMFERGE